MAPHESHSAVDASFPVGLPQCPQNGSVGSTSFLHLGQVPVGVSLARARNADGLPDPGTAVAANAAATGDPPVEYGIIDRAADADIGLPQSMQKRDADSFSRPQKVQAV